MRKSRAEAAGVRNVAESAPPQANQALTSENPPKPSSPNKGGRPAAPKTQAERLR
jgi:hypothetical protein